MLLNKNRKHPSHQLPPLLQSSHFHSRHEAFASILGTLQEKRKEKKESKAKAYTTEYPLE